MDKPESDDRKSTGDEAPQATEERPRPQPGEPAPAATRSGGRGREWDEALIDRKADDEAGDEQ